MKWGQVLSDDEIEAVTDYILRAQVSPEELKVSLKPVVDTKLYKLAIERLITKGLTIPRGIEFVDSRRAAPQNGRTTWVRLIAADYAAVMNPYFH